MPASFDWHQSPPLPRSNFGTGPSSPPTGSSSPPSSASPPAVVVLVPSLEPAGPPSPRPTPPVPSTDPLGSAPQLTRRPKRAATKPVRKSRISAPQVRHPP